MQLIKASIAVTAAAVVASAWHYEPHPPLKVALAELQHESPAVVGDKLSRMNLFVTLEEHYVPPALDGFDANAVEQLSRPLFSPDVPIRLPDAGELRLSNMTANGVRKQVLSAGAMPIYQSNISACRAANEQTKAAVDAHPDRYNAFATLPMALPEQAAAELERAVKKLGCVGALIDNHLPNNSFYDGAAYDVFWAKAQELDVPIYIHPTYPNISTITAPGGIFGPVGGDFTNGIGSLLGTVVWGWHEITGLHLARLYTAGVFVRYPKLKIVLGHMGEMVPFYLERMDSFLTKNNPDKPSFIDTYAQNVWITTSGLFSTNPIATMVRNTAIDHIMYSVDYPFGSTINGLAFMANLLTSGLVTPEEWEKIAFRNAENFLRIK